MNYYFKVLIVFVAYLIILSLITFLAYVIDKNRAKHNKKRIKEKTLLFLSSFGGAFGAFFGRLYAHHKTDKVYFSMIIYLSMLCEIIITILLVVGGLR